MQARIQSNLKFVPDIYLAIIVSLVFGLVVSVKGISLPLPNKCRKPSPLPQMIYDANRN